MIREIFKIKNISTGDVELKDFGIIIPSGMTVELDDYDKAVLSDELYTLFTLNVLVRVINGTIVSNINTAYDHSITDSVLQNYLTTGSSLSVANIYDIGTIYYNKTQTNTLLNNYLPTGSTFTTASITDLNTYYYNKTQTNTLLNNYLPTGSTFTTGSITDLNTYYYNKTQTNNLLNNYLPTGSTFSVNDISDLTTYYYDKNTVLTLVADKADINHTQTVSTITDISTYYYNKTQTNNLLNNYLPTGSTFSVNSITDIGTYYYTITQTNNFLNNKADKATTLFGYGITDAYTKTETLNQISGNTNDIARLNSTGILDGGIISINTDNTKFNITSGFGYIIDNYTNTKLPTVKFVYWSGYTAVTDNYLTSPTTLDTHIAIDINGNIVQFPTILTPEQLRNYIYLGKTVHTNSINLNTYISAPLAIYNDVLNTYDLASAIGVINITGNDFTQNATNLMQLDRSAGQIYRIGCNYEFLKKSPNIITTSAVTNLTFKYRYRNGLGGFTTSSATTIVDPSHYDSGTGALEVLPSNNRWTIQRVYYFTSNNTYLTYGQTVYSSYADAVNAASTEVQIVDPEFKDASLRAFIIVKKNATSLSDANDIILKSNKFGEYTAGNNGIVGTVTGTGSSIDTAIVLFNGTTGSVLESGTATCDLLGNANFNTVSESGTLLSNKYSLTGHTHIWSAINKSGSSIADLSIRNLSDITYVNTVYNTTSANTFLDSIGTFNSKVNGTGILSPTNNTIIIQSGQTGLIINSGYGYIVNSTTFKYITWNTQYFNLSGFSLNLYYFYIDSNSNINYSTTLPNTNTNIFLGGCYFTGDYIIASNSTGRLIDIFYNRVFDYTNNIGAFIYDNGCLLQRSGNTSGDTGLILYSAKGSIQHELQQYSVPEMTTKDQNNYFSNYYSAEGTWINLSVSTYYNNGRVGNIRYNDITKNRINLSSYNYTFTNGSNIVTCPTNLTGIVTIDHLIRLNTDSYIWDCPVSGVSWTGSQTNILLQFNYGGSTATGNANINMSLPMLPDNTYRKDLLIRTLDGKMIKFYSQTYYSTLDIAKTAVGSANIPAAVATNGVTIGYIIIQKYDQIINNILDVRPIPFIASQSAIGSGGATSVISHGSLTGLLNDDHPQYLRTDGTRNITGVISYNSNLNFTSDTNIISKKYVDDNIATRSITGHTHIVSNITDINTYYYTQTQINNILTNYLTSASTYLDYRYYTKTQVDNILTNYLTSASTITISKISDINTYYYTQTQINNLLSAYTTGATYSVSQINNFFSGTTLISGYNKTSWDIAYTNTHTHTNKSYLDAVGNNTIYHVNNLNKNNVSFTTNQLTIHTNIGTSSILAGTDNGETKLVLNSTSGGTYINNINSDLICLGGTGNVGINTTNFDTLNPEKLLIVSNNNSINIIKGISNHNDFSQFNLLNMSSGTSASSDFVVTNNLGSETTKFLDMGINSSNFNDPTFTVASANDSYFYNEGGHLAIGTSSNYNIRFFTSDTLLSNVRMLIDYTGNIYMYNSTYTSGTTNLYNNLTVYSGNTNLKSNLYTSGDTLLYNNLYVTNSSNLKSNLTVTGNTLLYNTLSVAGNTNLNSNLNITGNTFIYNNLYTSGDTKIYKTLFVSGNTNLNSNLNISGITNTYNDVILDSTNVYNFGLPTSSPLSSITSGYSHMFVMGNGTSLGNVTAFNIQWDLTNNGLYNFSLNINDGNPAYYINLLSLTSYTLNQANPTMTISGTGIAKFDGSYWVGLSGNDFMMVSKTGLFSIYVTNNNNFLNPSLNNYEIIGYDKNKKLYNTGFKPNYFGEEYQYVSSAATYSSNSTNYVTYLAIQTTNLPFGTYKICINYSMSHTANNNFVSAITFLNGTTQLGSIECWQPNSTTEKRILTRFNIVQLSGVNTISLQFKNSAASTIFYDGVIEIYRVL
jgi:hypothetical protein